VIAIKVKYRIITMSLIVLICAIISYVYLVSTDELATLYKEQTLESIKDTKKAFLKDTVNNLISEIDMLRESRRQFYNDLVAASAGRFKNLPEVPDAKYLELIETYFNAQPTAKNWIVVVWDSETKSVVYNPLELSISDWDQSKEALTATLSSYQIVNHGRYDFLIGISEAAIDAEVQAMIHDKVHRMRFSEDAYIWVNEVVNYEGGKDYAFRKIHPNKPETEGMLLSTDMTDIKGNLPYLVELEGINNDGEIFFTYFFQKLNSDIIAEKLTYAKLYKPYNWVIDMGIYLDDLQAFVDSTSNRSKELASKTVSILAILLFLIVFVGFGLQNINERWSYRLTKKGLEAEINYDTLTKVYSRNYGIKALTRCLEDSKKGGRLYTVMMFDIDAFKRINDQYGHDFGDVALISVSSAVLELIRATDSLIRWGGDEFIIIFDGLRKEMSETVAHKVLENVSNVKLETNEGIVVVPTISLGISYFENTDKDFNDVIKRADLAMYHAKSNGKNQVSTH
jgi:diguanylate cyclase (GGDEF)-like protein